MTRSLPLLMSAAILSCNGGDPFNGSWSIAGTLPSSGGNAGVSLPFNGNVFFKNASHSFVMDLNFTIGGNGPASLEVTGTYFVDGGKLSLMPQIVMAINNTSGAASTGPDQAKCLSFQQSAAQICIPATQSNQYTLQGNQFITVLQFLSALNTVTLTPGTATVNGARQFQTALP